jgi:hypothetical protein
MASMSWRVMDFVAAVCWSLVMSVCSVNVFWFGVFGVLVDGV